MTISPVSKGRISIDNLSVVFSSRGRELTAVSDVNISIEPGEFVCLLGPSGCGKSTLLNCIAGFVKPTLGSVSVDDQLIDAPGPDRGMVFQNHSLFPWKTVLKNVSFGRLYASFQFGINVFLVLLRYPFNLRKSTIVYFALPSVGTLFVPILASFKSYKVILDYQDVWPDAFFLFLNNSRQFLQRELVS